jgi:uncharacterized membrane protein YjgN (DUF898 family)
MAARPQPDGSDMSNKPGRPPGNARNERGGTGLPPGRSQGGPTPSGGSERSERGGTGPQTWPQLLTEEAPDPGAVIPAPFTIEIEALDDDTARSSPAARPAANPNPIANPGPNPAGELTLDIEPYDERAPAPVPAPARPAPAVLELAPPVPHPPKRSAPASTPQARSTAPTWAFELEDGELRREMGAPPKDAAAPAREPAVYREGLQFHGQGSEYFRVWVVNLFLTLVTLGIYSAWAKVRKARWFAQHTSLAGDRFDYHGEPWRILLGRVLALVLLGVWTLAFDLSPVVGLLVLGLFCVVGPLLFASAQRFRLANTSWRGLRFGYDVPRADVYMVCVPLLLLWTAGSVLDKLGVKGAWYVFAGLATAVGLPWAHARLKQLQHHHANYGEQQFSFRPAGNEFYQLYLKAFFLMVVGSVVAAPLVAMLVQAAGDGPRAIYVMLATAVAGLLMWLTAWPYFAARMQQIVWSHTELGHGVRFAGHMRGSKLWALVAGQTLLTVLTLGLYWPFAAVAIARYRVESIAVESLDPIGEVAGTMNVERRAAGDAALDFFGLDLGW